MADAVRDKGFKATTLADVVSRAGVSRRTFYEHFSDPVDCYLALAEETAEHIIAGVTTAMISDGTLAERVDRAVGVYLDMFADDPSLHRSYWTEAAASGERGSALHARLNARMAGLLSALAFEARRDDPSLLEVTEAAGLMLATGLRELAILTYDAGSPVQSVRESAVSVFLRVLGA